jgi:hypothetical protein
MSLRASVEDTIYQYAWGYDDDEPDLLAAAFAPDGTRRRALAVRPTPDPRRPRRRRPSSKARL